MKVVVLTGAGISAESGVPTFRDADGLWEGCDVEEAATPGAFAARPDVVHAFCDARRAALDTVEPNPAHAALARLEHALSDLGQSDDLLVVTQNIDDLHERAGSTRVLHMHGELRSALCAGCAARSPWSSPMGDDPTCASCGGGGLRPDVVSRPGRPVRLDRQLGRDVTDRWTHYPTVTTVTQTVRRSVTSPADVPGLRRRRS